MADQAPIGGAEVHHIGSTAVPAARPIIDMAALVESYESPIARLVADAIAPDWARALGVEVSRLGNQVGLGVGGYLLGADMDRRYWKFEGASKLEDVRERNVALTSLDAAVVAPVQAALQRESFLRNAALLTQLT